MYGMKKLLFYILVLGAFTSCAQTSKDSTSQKEIVTLMDSLNKDTTGMVEKTDAEWRAELTDEEYLVLRQKGTERPHTSEFNKNNDSGVYVCKGCGAELFSSNTKFDAHCGWPSFYESINKDNVEEIVDKTHGMTRTEVVCKKCKGHLGHVFNDGPSDKTGLRYCINGVSLGFEAKKRE
jgi:peptide-methionine (R)-S-oxide reductase